MNSRFALETKTIDLRPRRVVEYGIVGKEFDHRIGIKRIVCGENVSAFEVEKSITSHPDIQDCAAIGVPSELGEEDIKAYVQLVEGVDSLPPHEVIAWCKERIAYFKVPRYVEFVTNSRAP